MKKNLQLLLTGFVFIISGCQVRVNYSDPKTALSKVWMYIPGTVRDEKVDTLLSFTNFLELRPDGGFASYLGKYTTGTWTFDEATQSLHLQLDAGHERVIPVRKDESGRLILSFATMAMAAFSAHPVPSGWFHPEDPFVAANNAWRIPAKGRETDQQIRHRLETHCHFWVAYFKWADDNDVQLMDLRTIPSPVKIYGNGFGLTHFQDEPRPWTVNFYDTADARKAYNMLRSVFSKNDIKWPNTENDYKRFAAGFAQVEDWLKKEDVARQ